MINIQIYRSQIEFLDGRIFDDIWIDEETMLSYLEGISKDNVKRAEAFIMTCKPDRVTFDIDKYLYEYDKDGNYYFNVA